MNVADMMVETLQEVGVERVYGVVGDSLNGITEAIRSRGVIDWVHMGHEEAGAFGRRQAQLTGKLAVCAGSCGPGHLHLINGLYDCHRIGRWCWPSPPISRAPRSEAVIFRRPSPSGFSPNAAIIAS